MHTHTTTMTETDANDWFRTTQINAAHHYMSEQMRLDPASRPDLVCDLAPAAAHLYPDPYWDSPASTRPRTSAERLIEKVLDWEEEKRETSLPWRAALGALGVVWRVGRVVGALVTLCVLAGIPLYLGHTWGQWPSPLLPWLATIVWLGLLREVRRPAPSLNETPALRWPYAAWPWNQETVRGHLLDHAIQPDHLRRCFEWIDTYASARDRAYATLWLVTSGYTGDPLWFTSAAATDHDAARLSGLPLDLLPANPHDMDQVPPSVRLMFNTVGWPMF